VNTSSVSVDTGWADLRTNCNMRLTGEPWAQGCDASWLPPANTCRRCCGSMKCDMAQLSVVCGSRESGVVGVRGWGEAVWVLSCWGWLGVVQVQFAPLAS
jgi:hypothetical protein